LVAESCHAVAAGDSLAWQLWVVRRVAMTSPSRSRRAERRSARGRALFERFGSALQLNSRTQTSGEVPPRPSEARSVDDLGTRWIHSARRGTRTPSTGAPAQIGAHGEGDFGHLRVIPADLEAPTPAKVQSGCNSVTCESGRENVPGGHDPVRTALEATINHWTATGDVAALEARLGATVLLARRTR